MRLWRFVRALVAGKSDGSFFRVKSGEIIGLMGKIANDKSVGKFVERNVADERGGVGAFESPSWSSVDDLRLAVGRSIN